MAEATTDQGATTTSAERRVVGHWRKGRKGQTSKLLRLGRRALLSGNSPEGHFLEAKERELTEELARQQGHPPSVIQRDLIKHAALIALEILGARNAIVPIRNYYKLLRQVGLKVNTETSPAFDPLAALVGRRRRRPS